MEASIYGHQTCGNASGYRKFKLYMCFHYYVHIQNLSFMYAQLFYMHRYRSQIFICTSTFMYICDYYRYSHFHKYVYRSFTYIEDASIYVQFNICILIWKCKYKNVTHVESIFHICMPPYLCAYIVVSVIHNMTSIYTHRYVNAHI